MVKPVEKTSLAAETRPQSRFVAAGGLRLHYLDWGGEGRPALVLLHGVRLHAHCWSDFARRAQGKNHVLALDARGHGDSEWSPEGDYHLHTLYQDLERVVAETGLERFTLIGHSMGARTAMLYAHLHAARVERLVLVDMAAGLPPLLERVDFSRITATAPPRDFASHREAADYLEAILTRAPREMIEESVAFGMRQREDGRYVWKYDPSLGGAPRPRPGKREWDLWEAVRNIPCPALLLRGETSGVVTPELAERMAAEMPDCRVEVIAGAGHALFTEQPTAFAEAVERFLGAPGGAPPARSGTA